MTGPSKPDLRAHRDQLLSAANTFSTNSSEHLATMREKSAKWSRESVHALRTYVEYMTEQVRIALARIRDLAHHIPVEDTNHPDAVADTP
ncbi:hypothetical protein KIH27_14290 [Mycobacterium sp. M1]|uniref:ESX-1 secretion-associated protein n=1 Tax=Mycolicibacter acidiphilus TaxID=2835306 RepID=A0ABS5RMH1_9MYCO|nr:hypothetical protein [Mycolicibacter acidiphilus]MBS9534759.1 hypothetical protein [Mycolicibacter acidiphilus]